MLSRRAILTNPDLLSSTPWSKLLENDFWGTPLSDRGSHGSYRPLCVATFRLNHLLGGLEPWGYHLVNVALHAACTVLVVRVARKVLPGRNSLGHAITGFLFAAHPIHSEAVAGVVGRADLLACLFTLLAFLAYSAHCQRARSPFPLILALVSSTLATLAKETGISSLALCLLWELCRGESSRKVNCGLVTRTRSIGILSGRNTDWFDEESLYRSALHVNPPKAYGNLGSVLSAQGRVAEAEEAFVQALRYRPNMADVHYNLGILQQGRRNYEEAILSYQRAIHFRPSLAQAYVNLGAALASVGRGTEAAAVLRAGASLDGSGLKDKRAHEAARVQALLQLGALYADQGRLQRALSAYREALHALPDHYPPQSVYNLLGETLSRLQQYAEAERWFQASLASQPDHVPAHITYGKLLARNSSRVLEAERWFLRARRLAPDDSSVHHHYGLFLTSQGRLSEAAEEQLRAAECRGAVTYLYPAKNSLRYL
ncbi:protein O-mannosyl-transferase TMTC2 [Apis dorsata]|uniref:protein O-mannosyl-transferase TMTC2 n=1 Tax=Apis dorsata TaxID=7462 RepID=UPI001293820B|nr:protein O-mannosyl-transferase TMTC2 [Apis dorsata]